jgi:hypothetical protein
MSHSTRNFHDALICIALMACLFLTGCVNQNDTTDKSVDPPELNPHPTQRVRLYVTAPPSLKVSVGAVYRIGTWLGMIGGGGVYCGPDVDAPMNATVSHPVPGVTVPITFTSSGSTYAGEFFLDHFLLGRCRWGFASLDTLTPVNGFVSLYSQQTVNYNFDTSHSNGAYDQSADQSADLWCGADPSPRASERGKMLCTSLTYFLQYPGVVSNELLATIPIDQRDHSPSVNVFPFTKSITLRYHDIEAENRAAIDSGVFARGADANQPCPERGVRIYVGGRNEVTVNGVRVANMDMVRHLMKLAPAPELVCFVNAALPESPFAAGTALSSVAAVLRLPIVLYTDGTFATPLRAKRQ